MCTLFGNKKEVSSCDTFSPEVFLHLLGLFFSLLSLLLELFPDLVSLGGTVAGKLVDLALQVSSVLLAITASSVSS